MWKFVKGSFGRYTWLWLLIMFLGLVILFAPSPFARSQPEPDQTPAGTVNTDEVYLLTLNDEIVSPITANYIKNGIEQAASRGAEIVVIQLDTPGGLLSSTHTIVKDILNAPLPVVVYVSPSGARAGSAGVFITMASHVAVMAPYTRIGAAHPVDIGGNWPAEDEPGDKTTADKPAPPGQNVSREMSRKILNDTIAGIRAISKARGRNTEWAVRAVTESASITAEEALEKNVIDVIAPDMSSVLRQIDGRTVTVQEKPHTIALEAPQVVTYDFTPRQKFLNTLAHPLVAYFLLMIGFYGLLFEVTHPGLGVSGIVGGICLVLALIGMQAMSVNLAGLGLIFLGLVLFIAEVFTPTFGGLFLGGLACLILGTLFLYQSQEPYLMQAVPFMVGVAVLLGSLTGFLLFKVMKAYRKKSPSPYEKLLGQLGRVLVEIHPGHTGKVRVFGEIWDAESAEHLASDTEIQVVAVDHQSGSTVLKVERFVREA